MIKAFALTIILGGGVIPVSEFDVQYFLNNPKVHKEMLRRCHGDYELARTIECENAEAAGTLQLGRPLPPAASKPAPSIVPVIPKTRGTDRAA